MAQFRACSKLCGGDNVDGELASQPDEPGARWICHRSRNGDNRKPRKMHSMRKARLHFFWVESGAVLKRLFSKVRSALCHNHRLLKKLYREEEARRGDTASNNSNLSDNCSPGYGLHSAHGRLPAATASSRVA